MSDLTNYARRYADQYEAGSFETVLVAIRRKQVLSSLRRFPHSRVVEVGCGLEPLFVHAEDFERFVVVEPLPEHAENARRLAEDRADVTVYESSVGEVRQELRRFSADFIVVSSLLHEVEEPTGLLEDIRGVAGTSAVAHFNVPNVRSFHRLLALEMGLIEDVFEQSAMERAFGRHTRFDLEKLSTLLRSHGFSPLESGSYFVKPFTHDQLDQMLTRGIVGPQLIRGLEQMIRYMPELGAEIYVDAAVE